MAKKKSPTFVQSENNLYAVNRAAKRLARRKGIKAIPVPLTPLTRVTLYDESVGYTRVIDGQVVEYKPHRGNGNFWVA